MAGILALGIVGLVFVLGIIGLVFILGNKEKDERL